MKFKRIVSGSNVWVCFWLVQPWHRNPSKEKQIQTRKLHHKVGHTSDKQSLQHMMGTCLMLDNQEEVILSKFAVD